MSSKKKGGGLPAAQGAGTQTLPATIAPNMELPAGMTMVRRVTMPSFSLKQVGQRVIVTFLEPTRVSTVKTDDKKDPAIIAGVGVHFAAGFDEGKAPIVGNEYIFIVAKVVKARLDELYPDAGYVGKSFLMQNVGKKQGKSYNYHDFSIMEVNVPARS